MADVEVLLLGPFEVRRDGAPVHVPRGRPRALLAALALAGGRPVSVDALTERVWGDEPPRHARGALQNNVRRLRQLLGAGAIVTSGDAYSLVARVDAHRFLRLTEAAGDGPQLTEALALWRGEPLSGVESPALERDHGPALTERYLVALERRCDLDLAAGRHAELVRNLRDLVSRYPLRESLWLRLLRALDASGRRAEALATYQELRDQLAEQLGTDPSLELRQLHLQLVGEPPPDRAVPRQLPPEVPELVGRAGELAALDAAGSLLVLHGAGGVGKTALAVHWAHQRASRFPDGQLYLDLRGYGPQQPMPSTVALHTLLCGVGVPAGTVPVDRDEAAALWRTTLAGRRVLVLLDNARDAEQVRPLLPGGDSVALVTSRSQLRGLAVREGAHPVLVRELPEPEAVTLLAVAVGRPRVAAEPEPARELVALCGRLPLAVRIAAELASRFPEVSLAELVAELRGHGLDALADPDDAASDLRAVFSWSYLTLKPELAEAFRLLGCYPGDDIGLPAAAALLGVAEPAARLLLRQLTAVHLVEHPAPGRYRMHDLLREYAAERGAEESPDEAAQAMERLATWALHTAANARLVSGYEPGFTLVGDPDALPVPPLDFPDAAAAGAWNDREHRGLVALTRLAPAYGLHTHVWQLARMLRHHLDYRRLLDDWVAVAEAGLASAEAVGDPLGGMDAAVSLGAVLVRLGRMEEAERRLTQALTYAERVGDPGRVASALSNLAIAALRGGDLARSLACHRRAVAAARRGTHTKPLADALLNRGYTRIETGDPAGGILDTEEALALYRAAGSTSGQAFARGNLAEAHHRAGRHQRALAYAERALAWLHELGDRTGIAEVSITVGRAERALGHPDAARTAWQQAVDVLADQYDPLVTEARTLLTDLDR